MKKPIFDKSIFWDVDFITLDYDKYCNWVIVRVFERGDVADIRECYAYYGDTLIENALVSAKHINYNRLHLASTFINRPIQDFRCYTQIQLNQQHSPY
jgi:hypothetical protein